MSLTVAEIALANQSLDRIGSKNITYALQTTVEGVKCNTAYAQTRDSLLRSFEWNFASGRQKLDVIKKIILNTQPVSTAWVVGAVITGITSGTTATVLTVVSPTEYEIAYISGDFTDGETITDGTVEDVYWEGQTLFWEGGEVVWWDSSSSNELKCGTGYPVATTSSPDFRYNYQYQLPTDFLRFKHSHYHYTIEGKRLLSNEDSVKIAYVKQITDTILFDSLFTEVLILQLALKLINPIAGTNTTSLKQEIQQEIAEAMIRARVVCAAEINQSGSSDWNLARFGSGKVYSRDATHIR